MPLEYKDIAHIEEELREISSSLKNVSTAAEWFIAYAIAFVMFMVAALIINIIVGWFF